MLLAIDVAYDDAKNSALAAALVFASWTDASSVEERVRLHRGVAPYVPGSFYRRELPCLLPLIGELSVAHAIDVVVIDGYVDLGSSPGLGRHLANALKGPSIVGVAKTRFQSATNAIEVFRGGSVQPLFVTALGIDPASAATHVELMHGAHRIPTLLRRVDQLARGTATT